MPCNSSYMEQNDFELRVQETANHLKWLLEQLEKPSIKEVNKIANTIYPNKEQGDYVVAYLCAIIKDMSREEVDKFIYNGRVKKSRELADWWEEHELADRERKQKEIKVIQDEYELNKVLKSLTTNQKRLLSKHYGRQNTRQD